MFYDTQTVKNKLLKYYENGSFFHAYLQKKSLFPLQISLKKITQKQLQTNYQSITQKLQQLQKSGFTLLYDTFHFKTIGTQKLPVAVEVKTQEEFLKLIGKTAEFEKFSTLYHQIVSQFPKLHNLFETKPFLVLQQSDKWEKLLPVCHFFLQNRQPNIYIREININTIDTKFIEKNKKTIDLLLSVIEEREPLSALKEHAFEKRYHLKFPQPPVRFRILDRDLYIGGLSDITLPLDQFQSLKLACQRVFIVENKITTLSFFDFEKSIVIFGSGYNISLLKDVEWLKEKEIIYWGDIDIDGFAILSNLRSFLPHVHSLCMDEYTINRFKEYAISIEQKEKENLSHLTQEEQTILQRLLNHYYGKDFRLEQEFIPLEYVMQRVCNI